MTLPRVSIVVPAFNAGATLSETLESLLVQTVPEWEAVVIDDGSTDGTLEIARRFAAADRRFRVVRQTNRGESSARNSGLELARGEWLLFLDADDWILPTFLERMTQAAAELPEPEVVHCGWGRVTHDGRRGWDHFAPNRQNPFPELASYNCFAIHSCLLNRAVVESIGAFDETLKTCPDWDFLQRVARTGARFRAVPEVLSFYRLRPESAGTNALQILIDALEVISRGHAADPRVSPAAPEYAGGMPAPQMMTAKLGLACWAAGLAIGQGRPFESFIDRVGDGPAEIQAERAVEFLYGAVPVSVGEIETAWIELWPRTERGIDSFLEVLEARIQDPGWASRTKSLLMRTILKFAPPYPIERPVRPEKSEPDRESSAPSDLARPAPSGGSGPFAEPRRTEPVSRAWGYDRGLPVDRYYIERFLAEHQLDVRGRVLEVGDDSYTVRFGEGRVDRSDVLHVSPGNPKATFVGDLAHAEHIPSGAFDCIVFTQTLQFIYDVPATLRTLRRILKPGGVLLATFPGLTRCSRTELAGSWFWRLTPDSARRLFETEFASDELELSSHGNVLAACAFLYGLAAEELTAAELGHFDPEFDLIISVRAVKRASEPTLEADDNASRRHAATPSPTAPRALLLLYHRIEEAASDPWQLSVSPGHFEEQLRVLGNETNVVTLTDAVAVVANGTSDRPLAVITIDDGYADNLHRGLPILARHGMPATVFVCSGATAEGSEFWWDALERVLLRHPALPAELSITIRGERLHWRLDDSAVGPAVRRAPAWRAWEPPPTTRHEAYAAIWQRIFGLDVAERSRVLSELWQWAGPAAGAEPLHRALRPSELATLAASPLVEIGAHTVSHPALALLPARAQQAEIAGSRTELEALAGRPVKSFSFPFGRTSDYSRESVDLVRRSGFARACSNIPGVLRAGDDPFQLPRLHVADWNGDQFAERLRQWLAS